MARPFGKILSWAFGGIAVLAVVALLVWSTENQLSKTRPRRALPDGTRFELRQTSLTNQFTYQHDSRRWYHRWLEPVVPARLRPGWWPAGSGSMSMGTSETTNLMLVTVRSGAALATKNTLPVSLVQVFDEEGNSFDAAWGAGTLGFSTESAQLWRLSAFPRRGSRVGVRFVGNLPDASWTNIAEFSIPNPAAGSFPDWTPEPLPVRRPLSDMGVVLKTFRTGEAYLNQPWRSLAPRGTRCEFAFERDGKRVAGWSVHRLMMSDATGNRWEANTDGGTRSSDPGLIRFVGALWPGEPAWQLDVDLFRSGGFESAEVWKPSAMRLSAPSELQNLDLAWELSGVRLRLVALGGPQADHPMPYLWLCKYWGEEEKNRVVSLAVEMVAPGGRWHSVIVKAEDEQGRRVELLNHLDADRRHQAALLKPEEGARELRMEWSVQPIHTARFVARPEFVEPEAKGDASGPKQP